MQKTLLTLLLFSYGYLFAQNNAFTKVSKKEYQESATKINDLIHTKLIANFDYNNARLNGKLWLTLQPHCYPTDSLSLDAKGMDILEVNAISNTQSIKLVYTYDGMLLNIKLDKTYKATEHYIIYIAYTAKPNEYKAKGSAAITDAKGLYFINPTGSEKDKPTQIWTQGETEATSVWVPTIDKPNQKTTQEFYLTVPAKYVTLSNGALISQTLNNNGTRTDYWKMDLPHAPYLFFVGVGEYAIVKDKYKNKEVNYYVEKEYESVARKIFGLTPEMMKFFSEKTGVDYPWIKYSQIVGRDYVSGAMENTTATLHQQSAQQDERELVDGNNWETTIAHELFHQWFGDYVTAESWSNLTVNESFANYSEVLWMEYKYGKDAGDEENYKALQGYLNSESEEKDLVRFYYSDKEEMFDAVSYNKGGRILHMLRNYVGDDAFWKSLNIYLTENKLSTGEAHQLRLAFEKITGKDLNWFFNQWYFSNGHPNLDITYNYTDSNKMATVIVKQMQSNEMLFKLPVAIDIYNSNNKKRHMVWVTNKADTFYFPVSGKPDLINFDGDKVLLAIKQENKKTEEYIHQYQYAGSYLDRREAIEFLNKQTNDDKALTMLKTALTDQYHGLRLLTIKNLNISNDKIKNDMEPLLLRIAKTDKVALVRAAAIEKLAAYKKTAYADIFKNALKDSSYTVSGNALEALAKIDSNAAVETARQLIKLPNKKKLATAISEVLMRYGTGAEAEAIIENYEKTPLSEIKFQATLALGEYLIKINDTTICKRGINAIWKFRNDLPEIYFSQVDSFIIDLVLKPLANKKKEAGQIVLYDYIMGLLPLKK